MTNRPTRKVLVVRLVQGLWVVMTALITVLDVGCSLPVDAKLERRFRDHLGAFAELVSLAEQNNQIVTIATNFVIIPGHIIPNPDSASPQQWAECEGYGLSRERYRKYAQLLHSLDLHMLRKENGKVLLLAEPTSENYFVKGFVYSEAQLYPRVLDLDDYRRANARAGTATVVYKPIGLHWYLYLAPT